MIAMATFFIWLVPLSCSLQPTNMHFIKDILVVLQCPLQADQVTEQLFLVTNVTNEKDAYSTSFWNFM
jgi:hypothetical protein